MRLRLAPSTSICMLAVALFCTLPSKAEFPPEGAVLDQQNPALATGDYPNPTQRNSKAHYVFYFDCSKRMWIGVATSGSSGSSPLHGRQFPPGPPTGAVRDASDPNHATNHVTHQTFEFSKGIWIDAKSRQVPRSVKLCPEATIPAGRKPAVEPSPPTRAEKPDRLPPPPVVRTDGDSRH